MDLVLSILRCALGMLAVTAASVHSAGRPNPDYSLLVAERLLLLEELEALLASKALVVDACRHVVRDACTVVSLARRPVWFALARAPGEAWPGHVPKSG